LTGNGQRAGLSEVQGWALRRLLALHRSIREDLAVLRRAVGDGEGAARVERVGMSLRSFCDNFCRFIHGHHSVEDTVMFPSVLQFGGNGSDLQQVIDRLRAEHRTLSDYVDEVERTFGALPGDPAAMAAATAAVERLSEHLEAHLRFEEESLAPALNEVSRHVSPEDVDAPEPPAGIP
jgi:hemerythrin-like domain-containing protein